MTDTSTTVTHTFTLHNVGNGRGGAWLMATSSHDWPVTVPGGGFVAPLPCGGERTLRVVVAVPAGTPSGTRDTLTLTATSRLDPTVVERADVVTAVAFEVYLPLVVRDPHPALSQGEREKTLMTIVAGATLGQVRCLRWPASRIEL